MRKKLETPKSIKISLPDDVVIVVGDHNNLRKLDKIHPPRLSKTQIQNLKKKLVKIRRDFDKAAYELQ